MNSFNHYAYGAIGKWMYQVVAGIGIDPEQPGYKHIIINPRPGKGLTSAWATHTSLYGEITSGWDLDGGMMTMEVRIPANTSATIHIPGESADVLINGTGIGDSGIEYKETEGGIVARTGSGNYSITTKFPQ